MKVVIIGGVAGGATAAARLRRLDEEAEIIILERTGYVSYANCGLPYYIGGVIEDEAELTLQTPERFYERFRVQVKVRHEVTAIDRAAHCVEVRDLDSGKTFREPYDKLLLAPGAKPTQPPMAGTGLEGVFTLRTVEDTLRIRRFVEERKPRSAVLAGGGFIGMELAENLPPVWGDPAAVLRVYTNLIRNALDHGEGRMSIRLYLEKGRVVSRFANQTRELTAEDVPHVFDRFFTSDKMRTGRNTGLGLAIVKALADQMGCRLEAALEEDTFCIVLSWPAVREINAAV